MNSEKRKTHYSLFTFHYSLFTLHIVFIEVWNSLYAFEEIKQAVVFVR